MAATYLFQQDKHYDLKYDTGDVSIGDKINLIYDTGNINATSITSSGDISGSGNVYGNNFFATNNIIGNNGDFLNLINANLTNSERFIFVFLQINFISEKRLVGMRVVSITS